MGREMLSGAPKLKRDQARQQEGHELKGPTRCEDTEIQKSFY